jgi:hypothetical protein
VALLILLGGAAILVALSIAVFAFLLPSLDSTWGASAYRHPVHEKMVHRQQAIDLFWSDRKHGILMVLYGLMGLALVAFGLWGLYKVFMYFAADLDEEGHWNHLIAKRDARHHHRS